MGTLQASPLEYDDGLMSIVSNEVISSSRIRAYFQAIETAVDDNDSRISSNDTRISSNDSRISGNDTRISGNDTRISGNDSRISDNQQGIAELRSFASVRWLKRELPSSVEGATPDIPELAVIGIKAGKTYRVSLNARFFLQSNDDDVLVEILYGEEVLLALGPPAARDRDETSALFGSATF
ncbi:MAG: hypothetical protein AAFV29_04360, partial [Myxococcota bacterium]